ncbi:MAG: type II toxin-antitoxin system VapC family toxin [Sphingomonas taxi]
MYLVDTNVISELRKVADGRADPAVTQWFATVEDSRLHASVVSIMEIELGIARLDRRDPVQAAMLRRWLRDHVEPAFADGLLPITRAIAARCALLHVPDPRAERDAWIAATALVHDLVVVTRNVANFANTGVTIINPWDHRPN